MLEAIDSQSLNVHSVLVVRHGYVVTEAYYQTYRPETLHIQYSCTKSFTSALVGIALDRRLIPGVRTPVRSLLPTRTFAQSDARKDAMTLENLLTMSSGLDWTEGDPLIMQMVRSQDWVAFMLDRPMAEDPGSRFNYCSGCSHILSAIVQQATNGDSLGFARRELLEPLGIANARWDVDRSGIPIGGWGLYLTPRDMAKLGYLYLNDGEWDGKQIVPSAWVRASVEPHLQHVEADGDLGYGYQWWTYPRLGAYLARGRAGQLIFVLPQLDSVAVFTSDIPGDRPLFQLIEDYVVPAARSDGPLPANPVGVERLARLSVAAD
jgi:CubicO group peptidase (beta-lactamase class C family)